METEVILYMPKFDLSFPKPEYSFVFTKLISWQQMIANKADKNNTVYLIFVYFSMHGLNLVGDHMWVGDPWL